jgi:hypothetical protein
MVRAAPATAPTGSNRGNLTGRRVRLLGVFRQMYSARTREGVAAGCNRPRDAEAECRWPAYLVVDVDFVGFDSAVAEHDSGAIARAFGSTG